MIRFKAEDRIPTFSLYNNLCDIMRILECEDQLLKYNWFTKDVNSGEFKYNKLKKQSEED
jgi:hypothetical protein